jgi:integrase
MRIVNHIQAAKAPPGRHSDTEVKGLYLIVRGDGENRSWAFRFTKPSTRKVSEHGLGSFSDVSLAEARELVRDLRKAVRRGEDPVEQKRSRRSQSVTFGDVAADYITVKERRVRNPNTSKNERRLLFNHASVLGTMPIANIGIEHIKAKLLPLWLRTPHKARLTLAAVLRVFRYAKASGIEVASVAEMRESMKEFFPPIPGPKNHHKALDYAEVPELVRQLRAAQDDALSPCAIEFLLLTAKRANEVCAMRFSEVEEKLWTLPPERTKTGTKTNIPDCVPLCDRALELLARQRAATSGEYVWPSRDGIGHIGTKAIYKYVRETMGIPVTIHGFRATFRTWSGNETNFDRVTCELALGHKAGDAVELAYRRGDELSKRRRLMDAWAVFCEGREMAANSKPEE